MCPFERAKTDSLLARASRFSSFSVTDQGSTEKIRSSPMSSGPRRVGHAKWIPDRRRLVNRGVWGSAVGWGASCVAEEPDGERLVAAARVDHPHHVGAG